MSYLEITEIVLVHCNIVNNYHQRDSRVLYTFVPNKPFVQLLDIFACMATVHSFQNPLCTAIFFDIYCHMFFIVVCTAGMI